MSQVESYLSAAHETVHYVNKLMTIGSSSRLSDVLLSFFLSTSPKQCVDQIREAEPHYSHYSMTVDLMRALASEAIGAKCGNCGEQSAVAFIHLHDIYPTIRPLDYMQRNNGDHAFVVIGRAAGEAKDFASWGDQAVICDPWDRQAYLAKDVPGRMWTVTERDPYGPMWHERSRESIFAPSSILRVG
jgi:hypothetical protein